jgi:hypothetical protein
MNITTAMQIVPFSEKYPYLIPIIIALALIGFGIILWKGMNKFNETIEIKMNTFNIAIDLKMDKFKNEIDKNIKDRFDYIGNDIKAIKECNQDLIGKYHIFKMLFERWNIYEEIYNNYINGNLLLKESLEKEKIKKKSIV